MLKRVSKSLYIGSNLILNDLTLPHGSNVGGFRGLRFNENNVLLFGGFNTPLSFVNELTPGDVVIQGSAKIFCNVETNSIKINSTDENLVADLEIETLNINSSVRITSNTLEDYHLQHEVLRKITEGEKIENVYLEFKTFCKNIGVDTTNRINRINVLRQLSRYKLYVDGEIYSQNYARFNQGLISESKFVSKSDKRLKNVYGKSITYDDLQLINNIEVSDYYMIDSKGGTVNKQKKLIAQDIEKIFPQVVSYSTNFVPNIFKYCDSIFFSDKKSVKVFVKNDFKIGDVVMVKLRRILSDSSYSDLETMVCDVIHSDVSSFVFNCENIGKFSDLESDVKMFIYGKRVDDYRSVDYDGVSTLNISATQELSKVIATQEAELIDLNRAYLKQKVVLDDHLQKKQQIKNRLIKSLKQIHDIEKKLKKIEAFCSEP